MSICKEESSEKPHLVVGYEVALGRHQSQARRAHKSQSYSNLDSNRTAELFSLDLLLNWKHYKVSTICPYRRDWSKEPFNLVKNLSAGVSYLCFHIYFTFSILFSPLGLLKGTFETSHRIAELGTISESTLSPSSARDLWHPSVSLLDTPLGEGILVSQYLNTAWVKKGPMCQNLKNKKWFWHFFCLKVHLLALYVAKFERGSSK